MKKLLSVLFFVILSDCLFASNLSLVSGTYQLFNNAIANKSLFVRNASLEDNIDVVLWTNTNVPAQQWILIKNDDGTYSIVNKYSGKMLYRKGSALVGAQILQSNYYTTSTSSKWNLESVNNEPNLFYLYQFQQDGITKLYLEASSIEDGSSVLLGAFHEGEDNQRQIWRITNVEAINTNNYLRIIQDSLMSAWKAKYYNKASTGYVLGNGGWWGDAEMFEIILDAYETTGNQDYESMYRELYKNFIARNGTSWQNNEYNDDITWMVIASIRGYLLFGDNIYLIYAKTNFDKMYERALLPSGLLRWKESNDSQNGTTSCINGPAEVAACYLAEALNDDEYYLKARNLYALQRKYLFAPATGQVYDSFTWINGVPTNYNYWASTYNQGTFLGASIMLYNHFNDEMYKDDADMIMKYVSEKLCDVNGIINVCQVGSGDLSGFKGILMRYVRRFIVDMNKPEYVEWMQRNAIQAYNNRNSHGIVSSAWLTKTPENFILDNCSENCDFNSDPFGTSTAVSASFNAPFNQAFVKDAFSKIEAENFDCIKGVYVELDPVNSVKYIGNIKDGFYVVFKNVNFGNNQATSVVLNSSKSISPGCAIDLRVGGVSGRSIAQIAIPDTGDSWNVLSSNIIPIVGIQDICLVFKGPVNQNDLFCLDYFSFLSSTSVFSDLTDNGGVLSSSEKIDSLSNAIDNRLYSDVVLHKTANTWLTYHSKIPVMPKAYSLASSNGAVSADPKSWILQGSNDSINWTDIDIQNNQTFTGRLSKNSYELYLTSKYIFFRLIFIDNGGDDYIQFSEWQLYGESIFLDDITADGGSLINGSNTSSTNSNLRNLIDKTVSTDYVDNLNSFNVQYKANGIYNPYSYSITASAGSSDNDPLAWELYGSLDGTKWVLLDQQYNQRFDFRGCTQFYNITTNNSYQYYKLQILSSKSSVQACLAEWQLFGNVSYDNFYNDITMNQGELSSSGADNDALRYLIDNNGNSKTIFNNVSLPAYVQYKSSIPATLFAYTVVSGFSADTSPKNWILQGSNDGVQWVDIHSRSNISFAQVGERKTYTVTVNTKYKYFRFNITKLSGISSNQMVISEFELHGTGIASNDKTNGNINAQYVGINAAEGVDKLIDKSENTKYCIPFFGSAWVDYKLIDPISITSYSITSANDEPTRDPRTWTFEGSNNGLDWFVLDKQTKQIFPYRGVTQYYTCNRGQEKYEYYRLNLIENNGSNLLQFSEWQLLDITNGELPNEVPLVREKELVNIYPNPVSDFLTVDVLNAGVVAIYDMCGQLCFKQVVKQGVHKFQLSHLSRGVYTLIIEYGNQRASLKIIKK